MNPTFLFIRFQVLPSKANVHSVFVAPVDEGGREGVRHGAPTVSKLRTHNRGHAAEFHLAHITDPVELAKPRGGEKSGVGGGV